MGIVDPLPTTNTLNSSGQVSYVVTFIDRTTRWIKATIVQNITAECISFAFLNVWIWSPLFSCDTGEHNSNPSFSMNYQKSSGFTVSEQQQTTTKFIYPEAY